MTDDGPAEPTVSVNRRRLMGRPGAASNVVTPGRREGRADVSQAYRPRGMKIR